MNAAWTIDGAGLDDLRRVGELIALKVRAGDVIALHGDLGAGKTTFARCLLRALLGDADAEVPSPTFPLVQTYATPRIQVSHFDLYRLNGPDDLDEIGFHDAAGDGLVVIEWPERAAASLPAERLDVVLSAGASEDLRRIEIVAHGSFAPRLLRLRQIGEFLAGSDAAVGTLRIEYLQGDASARAYARLAGGPRPLVLMDVPRLPDGPPVWNGQPYSRIAHLAEDVRPFVAIGTALAATGVNVPIIRAADLDAGFVLLDDLGDSTFGRALADGASQPQMIAAAVDVLLHLRRHPIPRNLPLPDSSVHRLPRFDRAALEIEIGLLLDWYWPVVQGDDAPAAVRDEFMALWSPVLDHMLAAKPGIFLRDYHSPNLFWLPERQGLARLGVIDFQDALAEPWAYDLASLLQDARVDVPVSIEAAEMDRYCRAVATTDSDFDEPAFRALYAAFGAQRNTRLVGLWVRLLQRDGKPQYLQHMPRTWDYLTRNLAHPYLADLRAWYERHIPEAVRKSPILP